MRATIIEKYGNTSWIVEIALALVISFVIFILCSPIDWVMKYLDSNKEIIITLFGILLGFLLTAFTFLLTFNPGESKTLNTLKGSNEYRRILKSYISTSLVLIIIIGITMISTMEPTSWIPNLIALTTLIFAFLRIMKCLFYLYTIIELS